MSIKYGDLRRILDHYGHTLTLVSIGWVTLVNEYDPWMKLFRNLRGLPKLTSICLEEMTRECDERNVDQSVMFLVPGDDSRTRHQYTQANDESTFPRLQHPTWPHIQGL